MSDQTQDDDAETWLLEAGDRVIARRNREGTAALPPIERLIYSLWVADYGMRNAGDLATAADLHPDFLHEGREAASTLGLACSAAAFALSSAALERDYFARFAAIVAEIRAAVGGTG